MRDASSESWAAASNLPRKACGPDRDFFRTDPRRSLFYIIDKIGDGFQGVVDQHGWDGGKMKVEGFLHGNAFVMQTTSMIEGKNRSLVFTGYLLSDRMIANVSGINPDKQPAVGGVSWRKRK